MCLARSAHGLVPNHAIFQGPFPVDIDYEDVPTPDDYRHYIDGVDLPDTLPVWHVDEVDYRTDRSLRPGTVSTGWGFDDSPDAEVIAGGINSKGPSGVALGRHASLFLWGFAAEPTRMTQAGRHAFLNSICYIQAFDHQRPLVKNIARDRRWALQRVKDDPAELARVQKDLEFLTLDRRAHVIDGDCWALGIPNRSLELLEHCITAWEAGDDVVRAKTLLERYTDQRFESPGEWRRWFTAAKPRLFFSDVGGFRFFEALDPDAPLRRQAIETECPTVDADHPVEVTATVVPSDVVPGSILSVAVRLRHADGWHTYLDVPEDSPYPVTRIVLDLPEGWSTIGGWTRPVGTPLPTEAGVRIAEGDAVFVQRVRAGKVDNATIRARVGYQACDAERCLPPAEAAAEVEVHAAGGSGRVP